MAADYVSERSEKYTKPVEFAGGVTISNSAPVSGAAYSLGVKVLTKQITHADLTDADTSQDIAITGFPANGIPLRAWVELDTAFSGGTVSALTVSVGDAAAATELFVATSVFTGAAAGVLNGASEGAAVGKFRHEAAYSPIAQFVSTTDNLDALTAGSLTIHIAYLEGFTAAT